MSGLRKFQAIRSINSFHMFERVAGRDVAVEQGRNDVEYYSLFILKCIVTELEDIGIWKSYIQGLSPFLWIGRCSIYTD